MQHLEAIAALTSTRRGTDEEYKRILQAQLDQLEDLRTKNAALKSSLGHGLVCVCVLSLHLNAAGHDMHGGLAVHVQAGPASSTQQGRIDDLNAVANTYRRKVCLCHF